MSYLISNVNDDNVLPLIFNKNNIRHRFNKSKRAVRKNKNKNKNKISTKCKRKNRNGFR